MLCQMLKNGAFGNYILEQALFTPANLFEKVLYNIRYCIKISAVGY